MNFGWPNAEIGQKMANGRLISSTGEETPGQDSRVPTKKNSIFIDQGGDIALCHVVFTISHVTNSNGT